MEAWPQRSASQASQPGPEFLHCCARGPDERAALPAWAACTVLATLSAATPWTGPPAGERLLVPWYAVQSELAAALPEGVLRTGHRFLRYQEGEDGVVVEFDTPEGRRSLHAALLIGCDGGQSAVREQLIGDGPPQFLGEGGRGGRKEGRSGGLP